MSGVAPQIVPILGYAANLAPPTPPPGVVYTFLASDGVTLKQIDATGTISTFGGGGGLSPIAASNFLANPTGGSANPVATTPAQAQTLLGIGPSWTSTQLARIKALAPSAAIDTVAYYDSLVINQGLNNASGAINMSLALAGTGAITFGQGNSGVALLATGATANSKAELSSPNVGVPLIPNATSTPWAAVSRAKLQGAQDAQSSITPIALVDTAGTFTDVVFMNSFNTGWNMVMKSAASGLNQTVATTQMADFVNAHDYMILFDGTTIGMYIDGVLVTGGSTTSLTGLPSNATMLASIIRNGATTTSRTMLVDTLAFFAPSMT